MKNHFIIGTLTAGMLLASTSMGLAAPTNNFDIATAQRSAAEVHTTYSVQAKDFDASADVHSVKPIEAVTVSNAEILGFQVTEKTAYTAESYAQELERVTQQLSEQVQKKEITQQEAAKQIAAMQQTLQQIKDGTLTLYAFDLIDENGETLSCTLSESAKADSGAVVINIAK